MNSTLKTIALSCTLLAASTIITSCDNKKAQPADSKEIAEEHNDAKFNDNSLKKDADYISDAYSSGLCEIESAKRAKEFASAKETRDLASMLIEAHVKMNDKLQVLAKEKQVSLQAGLTADQLEEIKKTGDQRGVEYDKTYLSNVIDKHEKSISMFEKASEKSEDPEVKKLFGDALPELRNHLDMAMNTRNKLRQ